ncbi:MAG: agmatinase [Thermoplasmata archaeon]|nr:agmatinase [Thermoplasmata archaeon]
MASLLKFADASAEFGEATFVIFGAPFDRTTSFRPGARFAPNAIREHSYNFETFLFEHQIDLLDVPVCDLGNLDEVGDVDQMVELVRQTTAELVGANKFPIMLGGEHSVTIGAAKCFKETGFLIVDAHLDFRDSYMNSKNNHACVTRRIFEMAGPENVVCLGIRSVSKDEFGGDAKVQYIDAYQVNEEGIESVAKRVMNMLRCEKIYFSLDIDGIDPAYAPGTGTPEPFGLTPLQIKKLIHFIAPRLAGFDVVEVSPPSDNGNTSALAARIVREVIASAWKFRKQ